MKKEEASMKQSMEDLFKDLERYIEENWTGEDKELSCLDDAKKEVDTHTDLPLEENDSDQIKGGSGADGESFSVSLESLLQTVGNSFHERLFELIRESGMTDVEVYKRANIDRKLFSKIRNNPAYHPRKGTVLALAIALKLDIRDVEDLLARAEYALSPGSKSDVIIRYFMERKVYDIIVINIALHDHGLPVLE